MVMIPPASRTATSHSPSAKARSQSPSASDVAQAGAEAQTQIAAAEKTVTDAQTQAQFELDRLASDYDVRTEAEIRRRDTALEQERLKGYEALRDLQIKQQAELSHLHREGERALTDMKGILLRGRRAN